VGIGNQSSQKIGKEVGETAVSRMLDLGNIFELIVDGLNEDPLAQEEAIQQRHELGVHVATESGDKLQATLEERFK
jgi:hypothetical protein